MWVTYDHIDLFELTNHGLIVDDNQREMANVIISEDFFFVCFKLKQQINKALSLLCFASKSPQGGGITKKSRIVFFCFKLES